MKEWCKINKKSDAKGYDHKKKKKKKTKKHKKKKKKKKKKRQKGKKKKKKKKKKKSTYQANHGDIPELKGHFLIKLRLILIILKMDQ